MLLFYSSNMIKYGIKQYKGVVYVNIGDFIRTHRIKSGFKSQRKLADKSGVSVATISRIERNMQKPETRTLKDISKYLNTTTYSELMNVVGYRSENDENVESQIISIENLAGEAKLILDGKELSKEEMKSIIAFVRTLRNMSD